MALSGLAEGADTIFAEQAIALGISLDAIIAYRDLIADFSPGSSRARHLHLCALSRALHMLPFSERSVEAYSALGRQLVNSCDLLVEAWNGLPPIDEGGTSAVVSYAHMIGRPVIHVHTLQQTIMYTMI